MKTIRNLTKQEIVLEGFGCIQISENLDGKWHLDLFPYGSMNVRENLLLDTTFGLQKGFKFFEQPKYKK